MKAAEFRCSREFLGLSQRWVARRLSVDQHTVRSWESERAAVPEYAESFIRGLLDAAAQTVSRLALEWSAEHPLPVPLGSGDTTNGLPPSWYRHIAARVAERTGVEIHYSADKPFAETTIDNTDGDADEDELLTPTQLAQEWRTTEAGLAQRRHRGQGPRFVKIGMRVLYRRSDIRQFLDANARTGKEVSR